MLTWIDKLVRRSIATVFRGRFPGLYSTLDDSIEVPAQVAAYQLAVHKYIQPEDKVLDVGFGLGYGLKIVTEKARKLWGIEVDKKAVSRAQRMVHDTLGICELKHYDGRTIPYDTSFFDVVICIDVIEHVPEYKSLIEEMVRVSKRVVLLSTPNRRPEYTRHDGKPKNRWHLREWSYEELNAILQKIPNIYVDWNFLNGPWDGPFECTAVATDNTLAFMPALVLFSSQGQQDDDLYNG